MRKCTSKVAKQFFSLFLVSFASFFCRRVNSDMPKFVVIADSGSVFALCFLNAFKASIATTSHIGGILRASRLSQIGNSIVAFVSIYMVKKSLWKFSMHKKPCKPVSSIFFAHNVNVYVSAVMQNTGFLANQAFLYRFSNSGSPNKPSCIRLIPEAIFQFIKRHHMMVVYL